MRGAWIQALLLFLPAAAYGAEETLSEGLFRSVLAAAAMLAVLLAVAWVARRMSGVRLNRSNGDGRIRLVSQKPLGMREKLVLIEVDGTKVLLGITQNNIQRLHLVEAGGTANGAANSPRDESEQC